MVPSARPPAAAQGLPYPSPPMTRLILVSLAALLFAPSVLAQTPDATRRVVLVDGTVVVGAVADEGADPVVVRMPDGTERRVPRALIAEVGPLAGGRFARVDPTRTRLVSAPTGRTLGRGRRRVGTRVVGTGVFSANSGPGASVGVGRRVDVSGALGLGFSGDNVAVLPSVGAKVGLVDTGRFAAAVGADVQLLVGTETDGAVTVAPYAALTLGSELRSVSASVTFALGGELGGDFSGGEAVLVALGGETQVSDRVKLLLDVQAPVSGDVNGLFAFPGVRLFGDRFSVDVFGVVGFVGDQALGSAPSANFTYTF